MSSTSSPPQQTQYISTLPACTELAPCASYVVSSVVQQLTNGLCLPTPAALANCACTDNQTSASIASDISSDVVQSCGTTATEDVVSALIVFSVYCAGGSQASFPGIPVTPVTEYISDLPEISSISQCASSGLGYIIQGLTTSECPSAATALVSCACFKNDNYPSVSSAIQTKVEALCDTSGAAQAATALSVFKVYCSLANSNVGAAVTGTTSGLSSTSTAASASSPSSLTSPQSSATNLAAILSGSIVGFVVIMCLVLLCSIPRTRNFIWSRLGILGRNGKEGAGRVFRIRGIPLVWGIEDVRSILVHNEDMKVQDNPPDPTIMSLAEDVSKPSKVGTVKFRVLPSKLDKLHQLSIRVPYASNDGQPSMSQDITLTLDDKFEGITTLYCPPPGDHKVDIIAISGLGGHAFGSFKQRGGDHMWLRDSLPHDLTSDDGNSPMARVMIYGYESGLAGSSSIQNLEGLATSLHTNLLALRTTGKTNSGRMKPIIFIAHSLGGLIVKQTLISISQSTKEDDREIISAVYGILFFGVPHDGLDITSLIPMVGRQPNLPLLYSLGRDNSQVLTKLHREFHNALGGQGESEIFCFYETLQSPTAQKAKNGQWAMTGPEAVLVTQSSATHGRHWEMGPEHMCAINRTHSEIVKFGAHDPEYDKVLVQIRGLVRRAVDRRAGGT